MRRIYDGEHTRFAIASIFAPTDDSRPALPIIDYILVDPFKRTRDGKGTFDIASFGVNPDFHAAALFVEHFEGSYVYAHGFGTSCHKWIKGRPLVMTIDLLSTLRYPLDTRWHTFYLKKKCANQMYMFNSL